MDESFQNKVDDIIESLANIDTDIHKCKACGLKIADKNLNAIDDDESYVEGKTLIVFSLFKQTLTLTWVGVTHGHYF